MNNEKNLWSGNRGEWSELYAFFMLIHSGKLMSADENAQIRGTDFFIPILRVLRENNNETLSYFTITNASDGSPQVHIKNEHGKLLTVKSVKEIYEQATFLLDAIKTTHQTKGAFTIEKTQSFAESLLIERLKAPSHKKADITLQIKDVFTGTEPIWGWSIKSELGSPPTLLNASRATNFRYRIENCNQELANEINSLVNNKERVDLKNRVSRLKHNLVFDCAHNQTFNRNMQLIDLAFPEIMAYALLEYYSGGQPHCVNIIDSLEKDDPLNIGTGMYTYKMKRFLFSVALGLRPADPWNGRDEANGGYIIVREDGEISAYHLYNRGDFEDYLFTHTRFETPSTSRHGFGEVYQENGQWYFDLNCQIRFL